MSAATTVVAALVDALERASGDVVVLVDAEGRITALSSSAERLLGLSRATVLGAPAEAVLPLPKRAVDVSSPAERLSQGLPWAAAVDLRAAGLRLSWAMTPILEDGRPIGGVYRATQPASETGAPAALAVQRAVELAFQRGMSAQTIVDRNRRVVAQNRAGTKATEAVLGRGLHPGEDILTAVPPGAELGMLDGIARALEGEEVRRTRRVRFPNGVEIENLVQYAPLGAEGNVEGILVGALQHTVDREPAERLQLLERALELSSSMVLVCDARQADLPIVYASSNFERMTGYPPAEVLGRNPRFLQGEEGNQSALSVLRAAIAEGAPCEVLLRNRRKDGVPFLNRLRLAPVRDDLGAVSHFIGVQEDVTHANELLHRQSAASLAELRHREFAGVLHEIKNMLMVLSAANELLEDDAGNPERVLEYAADGRAALERLRSILRSHLSPQHIDAAPQAVHLREVLDAVSAFCRRLCPEGLVFAVQDVPDEAFVLGTQAGLEQVLVNLVVNAIDATPAPGRIELRVVREGGWTLEVSDTGAGMTRETIARIFDPFFTTKPAGKGTGLGLSTCAALVTSFGGKLTVDSERGRGTTFRVALAAVGAAATPPVVVGVARARVVVGREVLVIDPDPSVRAALATLLRRRGARVVDAGDEASARADSTFGPAAVLLLDSAPTSGTDGTLGWWLSADPRRAAVLMGEGRGEALPPRVTLLPKPFDPDALVRAIASISGPE